MPRLSLFAALALSVALVSASRLPAPPLPPPTASSGQAIEKHLLDDTDFLLVVNVKEAAKSKFFTKHLQADIEKLLGRPEVKPYLKDAGIDALKDVEQLIVCMGKSCYSAKGPRTSEDGPIVLFQGKFDKTKIDAQLTKLVTDGKAKAVESGKAKFHRLTLGGPGDSGPYVAVLDKSTFLLCGSKEQVVEQINRVSGKSKAKLKYPAISAFLKARGKTPSTVDVIGLESMITGTSYTSQKVPGGGGESKVTHHTLGDEGFKQFTVQVKVKDDARGSLRMDVKKPGDLDAKLKEAHKLIAEMKRDLDRGAGGPGGPPAEQMAKLKEFVNGIKLKSDKGAVVYEATGTGEQAAAVVKIFLSFFERF